jgi:hypothetical protein
MHYSGDRGWYMQELRKAHAAENGMLHKETAKKERKKKI